MFLTRSFVRWISVLAWLSGFPCSRDSSSASASLLISRSQRNGRILHFRSSTVVKARRAASTAVSRSCLLDKGTRGFGWSLLGVTALWICPVSCCQLPCVVDYRWCYGIPSRKAQCNIHIALHYIEINQLHTDSILVPGVKGHCELSWFISF